MIIMALIFGAAAALAWWYTALWWNDDTMFWVPLFVALVLSIATVAFVMTEVL